MRRNFRIISILILPLMIFACQPGGPSKVQPVPPAGTGQPTLPEAAATAANPPSGNGGSLALSNPAQGLDALPAYRAAYQLSFDGSRSGKPSQWSQSYMLTVVRDPASRVLTYSQKGLEAGTEPFAAMEGVINGVRYVKQTVKDACAAEFADKQGDPGADLPELAGLLPAVDMTAAQGQAETINGVSAVPYEVDGSGLAGHGASLVKGKAWIASNGKSLVKYELAVKGSQAYFGPGIEGTMTWEYELDQVRAAEVGLPLDCPQALPEIPLMGDASQVVKFPNIVSYATASSMQDVADFYQTSLPRSGFQAEGEQLGGADHASLQFRKDGLAIMIRIEAGHPTQVQIQSRAGQTATDTGASSETGQATPTAASSAANINQRVANAFNLAVGSTDTPSAFPAYHLEAQVQAPNLNAAQNAVEIVNTAVKADVQGKDMHFFITDAKSPAPREAYLAGGKQVEVNAGKLVDSDTVEMSWVTWQLNVVFPFGYGSAGPSTVGTETIDGRPAEVYDLDSSKAPPESLQILDGFNLVPISAARGRLWIDQQTGAMLKLSMDYTVDFKDKSTQAEIGQGSGHIELAFTQIGQVQVNLP